MADLKLMRADVDFASFMSLGSMRAFGKLLEQVSDTELNELDQDKVEKELKNVRRMAEETLYLLHEAAEAWKLKSPDLQELQDILNVAARTIQDQIVAFTMVSGAGFRIMEKRASNRGKVAAEALHGKVGGSRSKADEVRRLWASGKYTSRDICAEQECGGLGMSFSAARKALRGTPDSA